MSGLSLELLEHGTGLGGSWLCTQVKQPALEQQGLVFVLSGYMACSKVCRPV